MRTLLQNAYFFLRSLPYLGPAGSFKLAWSRMAGGEYSIRPLVLSHPLNIRGKSSDSLVLYASFCRQAYPLPKDSSVRLVVDAGANIGCTAAHFAEAFPLAKVIALEPEESNFRRLQKNCAAWNNILPLQKGLWWRPALVGVSNVGAENWCFEFAESADGIPTVTMADLMAEFGGEGSVLVKMDIEGAEKMIFAQNAGWLGGVRHLYIEIHDAWKEVFGALAPYEYSARIVDENVLVTFRKADGRESGSQG